MITSIRLFGFEVFRLERVPIDAGQFVELSTETELDEEAEPDIVARTYGFGPASHYL